MRLPWRKLPLILLALSTACGGTPVASETPRPARSVVSPEGPEREVTPATDLAVGGDFLTPMPTAVTSFGAASDGQYLYVLGGYHGTPHQYSREHQSAELLRLPLDSSGAWESVARLEAGVQGIALIAYDGRVCRFGGNRILNAEGEDARMRSLNQAACLSVESNEWTALPDLPTGRSSHEAARIGSTVYIAGGWQLDGAAGSGEWQPNVLAIDLDAPDAWRTIEAPFSRRALGVAATDTHLVVIGGIAGSDISSRTDVLDPASNGWSRGPDFPGEIEVAAFGIAAVGRGDAIYASGREGVVFRWRVGEPEWSRVGTQAFGRFFHQLVARSDSELIAVGGIGGMHTEGRTRIVEVVDIAGTSPRIATLSMAFPGSARNRQGLMLFGETLFFFGGNNSLGQHDFEPENFITEGWRLHLAALHWSTAASYPAGRQTMHTIVREEVGISVAGFGHDGENAISFDDAFTYDPERDAWIPRPGLPRGRTQFGMVEHEEQMFIFGGLNFDPTREGMTAFEHVTSILVAPVDGSAPFEAIDVPIPGPRRAFAGAALDGSYVMVGGMQEGFAVVSDCVAFQFTDRTFREFPCPRQPRVGGQMVALDGRLYLGAGASRTEEGLAQDRSIEVFDPSTNEWSVLLEEIPIDTRHVRMLRHDDRLLFLSTQHEAARLEIALVDPRRPHD